MNTAQIKIFKNILFQVVEKECNEFLAQLEYFPFSVQHDSIADFNGVILHVILVTYSGTIKNNGL
jgi:hypothetical protein